MGVRAVNRPITRLFAFVALLFALLVAFTSRWTVFEASSLRSNPSQRPQLLEQEKIKRGEILAADGTVLARSLPGREGTYSRTYPTGSLFAHPLGYYFTELGATGLERYRNNVLEGQTQSNLQTILNQLQGIKPPATRSSRRWTRPPSGSPNGAGRTPRGRRGARPPHRRRPRDGLQPLLRTQLPAHPRRAGTGVANSSGALVNRAVQDGYAPGSTFKVVTATAAIDTGRYTPESVVSGRDGVLISGSRCKRPTRELRRHHPHRGAGALGQHRLRPGRGELGKGILGRYMRRFGFNREPELDYPSDEMSVSGEYSNGRVIAPTSPKVDVGRMGIGQDKLEVTALQMAQVAAAVANGGRLMVPHLTSRIVDSEGRTVKRSTRAAVGRDETLDRHSRGGDDGRGRGRRNRHLGADPRRRRGRQDRAPPRPRSATPSTTSGSSPSPPSATPAWLSR